MNGTMDRLIKLFDEVFQGEVALKGITADSRLIDDIGMNSIGLLYMAMAVEEEFGISFKNQDLENIRTVGDVIDKIEGA